MRFLWGFWRTWNYLFLRRKKSEPVIRISTAVESPSPSVNTHYNVTGEMMIEVRWQNARQNALGGHEGYHLRSACLAYLLGSFMWKTLSSISFPPSSTPSPPRCRSGSEAKRLLDNNVTVAKLTLLKDASSSAPVTQKSERTLASLRRERWCWEAWVPWECYRGWVCSVRRASSWGRRRSEIRWKVSTCWRRVMGENGGICRGTLWWGNNSTEQVACCSVLRLIDIIEYDGAGNKTFGYKKTRYHI